MRRRASALVSGAVPRINGVLRSATLVALLAMPLAAQSSEFRITATGGAATDIRGVRSGGFTLSPTLAFRGEGARFAIAARGSRYSNGAWSAGGGVEGSARQPIGRFLAIAADASADYTRTSYEIGYLTGQLLPRAEAGIGPVLVFAGATMSAARTDMPAPATDPLLPLRPAPAPIERTAVGPVAGARLLLALPGASVLRLGYREERPALDGVRWTDRTATLGLARGAVYAGGSLGWRRAPGERSRFGGVELSGALTPRFTLLGTAFQYPGNRLSGTPPGRTIVIGVSALLGPVGGGSLPVPSAIGPPGPGFTRLAIRAREARDVELAGDWNQWTPVPAIRAANGVWYLDLHLPPGAYRYGFRIDRARWAVPTGATVVADGFGGRAAWLVVTDRTRGALTASPTTKE